MQCRTNFCHAQRVVFWRLFGNYLERFAGLGLRGVFDCLLRGDSEPSGKTTGSNKQFGVILILQQEPSEIVWREVGLILYVSSEKTVKAATLLSIVKKRSCLSRTNES